MDPASSRRPAQAGIQAGSGVDIIVEEPGWRRAVPGVERIVARAATLAGGVDTVVLASDRMLRRLNARHRGRNKPTNVLSFEPGAAGAGGELVIALGVVRREAAAAARRTTHHLSHLVVHGALHLDGHDHGAAGAARRMEMEEARLLHRLRVPNPWRRA
jgi:probable rRNA maturation factor